ncbi:MAG: NifB/NifX family molybdenum-iron cluster-binding protein [bacterium]
MKISIPVAQNQGHESTISEHFGRTPYFAFIEIDDNGKHFIEVEENPLDSHKPGDMPTYLSQKNVDKLIVRGVGARAIAYFQQMGIEVIRGADGTVEEIIDAYKNKKLSSKEYTPSDKNHH